MLAAPFAGAQSTVTTTVTVTTAELADLLVEEGKKYTGVPYRMGGNGPKSFDCSGFVHYVYMKYGMNLPRSSDKMAQFGMPVEGSVSELQKGDLVFFNGRRRGSGIGHVGIYIGPDSTDGSFSFIHTAVKGGVQISHLSEEYYSSRFVGACRILPTFYALEAEPGRSVETDYSNVVEIPRDTLQLGPDDMRVVIFASGEWALVEPDGSVSAPKADTRIVLNSNGTWSLVKMSTHTIPSMIQPEPAVDTTIAANATEPVLTAPAPVTEVYHTIKSGDTLSSIARKNGTTVSALCKLNGITTKTVLKIGRRLRVK